MAGDTSARPAPEGRAVVGDERTNEPVRLAIVDDYDVIVVGVSHLFDAYGDRIDVVQLSAETPVTTPVDVSLLDTFAQGEADAEDLDVLLANPLAGRVVVYTWVFAPHLIEIALRKGAAGYLSKTMSAGELVEAIERVHTGEIVVSAPPERKATGGVDWPGRTSGLSERESEVVSLITQGRSNAEIAAMTYLSPNSVKTYIRSAYQKMGVKSRSQAVLWGIEHGLHVTKRRVDDWRF